jgi:hypothetical protein
MMGASSAACAPDLCRIVQELRQAVEHATHLQLQETLPPLLQVVRQYGVLLEIDVQKKMHEIVYAHSCGLTVIKAQGGADLLDQRTGEVFEHKSMKLDLASKMCNVNIKLPAWPTHTERAVYAQLAHDFVLKKGAVIIEARSCAVDVCAYEVRLPASFMARYVKEHILAHVSTRRLSNLNIGGRACPTCQRVHRIDALERDAHREAALSDDDWRQIVLRKTKYKCTTDA